MKLIKTKRTVVEENAMIMLGLTLAVQLLFGIMTLLTSVQIALASLHQVGAFFLFSACIYLKFVYREKEPLRMSD